LNKGCPRDNQLNSEKNKNKIIHVQGLDRLAPESLAKNNLYGVVNNGILIYGIKITYL